MCVGLSGRPSSLLSRVLLLVSFSPSYVRCLCVHCGECVDIGAVHGEDSSPLSWHSSLPLFAFLRSLFVSCAFFVFFKVRERHATRDGRLRTVIKRSCEDVSAQLLNLEGAWSATDFFPSIKTATVKRETRKLP